VTRALSIDDEWSIKGVAIPTTEVKRGQVMKLDGEYWLVSDFQHITPGNWRGFIQFKLKSLGSGSVVEKRMSADAKVEVVFLDKKDCEYLYRQGQDHVFMDSESYEQYELPHDVCAPALPFMKENMTVTVTFLEGKPISVDLPASVVLEVTEAEAAIKGNTATDVKKNATLETGHVVKVPHFISAGDKVKVDTRTGDFIQRVN
jgi:elongation factor P